MLAQNFKSAVDLGITEPQLSALIKTLVLLETGKLKHEPIGDDYYPNQGEFTGQFNMLHWNSSVHNCGTVACIGGTAELISGVSFRADGTDMKLDSLFMPDLPEAAWNLITPAQASTALRSYLTTGDAHWDLAVAS